MFNETRGSVYVKACSLSAHSPDNFSGLNIAPAQDDRTGRKRGERVQPDVNQVEVHRRNFLERAALPDHELLPAEDFASAAIALTLNCEPSQNGLQPS